MKDAVNYAEIWDEDRLGYAEIGAAFTNIVKSIAASKVISIEAPFGHGKTFFRRRWVKQLRASGELVIEIDAQQSDHSGDPLITFMGALLDAQPRCGKPLSKRIAADGLKLAGALGKASLRFLLRQGADELLDVTADWAKENNPDIEMIEKAVDEMKAGLSNAAAQMIATHLAAEHARVKELPAQIDEIRNALTYGADNPRIVIVIDELDRCHPEYAISLLEAMKLIFGRDGFVFCLMVNPNYLETIATHRFGTGKNDELYLEKFIDLRLHLKADSDAMVAATQEQIRKIPLPVPFGPDETFGHEPAAAIIDKILSERKVSYRQIKRIIERIELVTRCYPKEPIDLPLLVFLAFNDATAREGERSLRPRDILKRAELTPEKGQEILKSRVSAPGSDIRERNGRIEYQVIQDYGVLAGLPRDRYRFQDERHYPEWYQVVGGLAPHYHPQHKAMLAGVMKLQAA